jgi:hypothetical protein
MNAVAAPVVSSDNTSPEAILAREAKRLQAQAVADTEYDDKNFEDFADYTDPAGRRLVHATLITAAFLALTIFITRK